MQQLVQKKICQKKSKKTCDLVRRQIRSAIVRQMFTQLAEHADKKFFFLLCQSGNTSQRPVQITVFPCAIHNDLCRVLCRNIHKKNAESFFNRFKNSQFNINLTALFSTVRPHGKRKNMRFSSPVSGKRLDFSVKCSII